MKNFAYTPQPRQMLLHATKAKQILFGGAAGGGKSHALRMDAILFCLNNPGLAAYIFRRNRTQLISTHIRRTRMELDPLGVGEYSAVRNAYEFKNGSVLYFCFVDREDDVFRYLSEEMNWLGFDEATQLTPTQISFICTRLRLGGLQVVDKDRLPRVVFASNPGGPSHNFLKEKFRIGEAEPEVIFHDKTMAFGDNDPGWTSIFIPSTMRDNAYLDADYAAAFGALSPELARAYREGDWSVILGQAIHNIDPKRHKIRSFTLPEHWPVYVSMDWGTATPYSIGWYTVSDGGKLKGRGTWPDVHLPKGALIRFAELYGYGGQSNIGTREPPQTVTLKMLQKEQEMNVSPLFRVADSAMFAKRDELSTIEWMERVDPLEYPELCIRNPVMFTPSKKGREAGYMEVLARLAGTPDFKSTGTDTIHPMLFVTENCTHFWRTVPALQLDDLHPEKGPADRQEDHVYDELVYMCGAFPFARTKDEYDRELVTEAMREANSRRIPYAR